MPITTGRQNGLSYGCCEKNTLTLREEVYSNMADIAAIVGTRDMIIYPEMVTLSFLPTGRERASGVETFRYLRDAACGGTEGEGEGRSWPQDPQVGPFLGHARTTATASQIIFNIEVAQRPNRERDPEIGDQRLALRPSRRDRGWHCARSWMVSQPSDEVSG